MKKGIRYQLVMMLLTGFLVMCACTEISAETNKVTYTLEDDGIITISGKGEMPKSMKFQYNKKIKRVVIEKGVTSVSENAFLWCENLESVSIASSVKKLSPCCFYGTNIKKIVIPSSVKIIGRMAFNRCDSLEEVTMPGHFKMTGYKDEFVSEEIYSTEGRYIKTINFNTSLDLKKLIYLRAENWNVWSKDKKYKSINGVIYSKNGKELVRVPSLRKSLVIEEGCKTFCLSSIFYGYDQMERGAVASCFQLESITIAKTVNKIEDKKYRAGLYCPGGLCINKIVNKSKKINKDSIVAFYKSIRSEEGYRISIKKFYKAFKSKIIHKNGLYICKNTWLGYDGKKSTIKVPKGVKTIVGGVICSDKARRKKKGLRIILPNSVRIIEDKAFYCTNIRKINLPKGLKTIGDEAFNHSLNAKIKEISIPSSVKNFGIRIFRGSSIEKVQLPDNMKIIPLGMFEGCFSLRSINTPASLEIISRYAFSYTKVNVQELLNAKNLRYIGIYAFEGTNWTNLTIPAHIKKIKAQAFEDSSSDSENLTVHFMGNTSGYSSKAFYTYSTKTITFDFGDRISQSYTEMYFSTNRIKKQDVVEFRWRKVMNADGYELLVSPDTNFKKKVKKYILGKNEMMKRIVSPNHKDDNARIRPFKIVGDKKIYGRWTRSR